MTKPSITSTPQRRGPVRNRPAPMALEQRLMFDAAGAVDVASAAADTFARDTATADLQRSSAAAAAAETAAVQAVLPFTAVAPDAPVPGERREVAFVDTGVAGYQALVAGIRPGVEVVLVDAQGSGLAQLAAWADSHSGYDTIHVLSHGADGLVYLGRDSLSAANIGSDALQAQLQQLGRALAADGDLMLYGCNVADGAAGQAFVQQLAAATGAEVAASTDATGAAAQGGNWTLEQRSGATGDALQITSFGSLLANETLSVAGATLLGQGYGPNVGAELTSGEAGSAAGHIEVHFTDSVTGAKAGYVSMQDLSAYSGGSGKGIYHALTDGSDMAYGDYKDSNNDSRIDADSHDTKYLVIRRTDGAAFSLKELQITFLNDLTLKVIGYSSGSSTGQVSFIQSNVNNSASAQAVSLNSLFTGNAAFDNVDQVRVTATSYPTSWALDMVDGSRDLLDTAMGVATRSITIGDVAVADSTPPTVTSVSASSANGSHKVGDVIAVQVNFSEAVTVTGTPQLTLETGSTDRAVNYSSGTGTSTLTFNYTVQAGDTSADLDAIGTSALALNGGTIKDGAGNDATLTLATPGAAGSLGANKALVIDGVAPLFSSVATNANGTKLTLTYNDTLSATTAATSAFTVKVDNITRSVTAAVVSGSTVELTLGIAVNRGEVVTVSYTDPTAGNDAAAVQDSLGNDAASFTNAVASNNAAAQYYASFNQIFSATHPSGNSFAVTTPVTLDTHGVRLYPVDPRQTAYTATTTFASNGSSNSVWLVYNGTATQMYLTNGEQRNGAGPEDAWVVANNTSMNAATVFFVLSSGSITLPGNNSENINSSINLSSLDNLVSNQTATLPTLDLDASGAGNNYTVNYNAGGNAVAVVDTDVLISDTDSANMSSATVLLVNAQAGDSLSAGTMPGGITASVTNGGATVTLTGSATKAAYQTALQAITFANSNGSPDTTTRAIAIKVSDGTGDSNTANTSIVFPGPNTAPVVAGLNGDSVSFTEGGSAVLLDAGSNATVTDAESLNFDSGTLTASIVTNRSTGEDGLAVVNQGSGAGQIGVSGSTISHGGTAIATFTGGSGSNDLVITFNSSATPAAAQALVRALTYANSNTDDPSTAQRTVRLTLTDGDGGSSSAADVAVTVVPVNDAPTLGATGGTPSFTEGSAAVDLFSAVSIGTVESGQSIDRLTLTVSNLANGSSELLTIDGTELALTHGNSATTAGNGLSVSVVVAGSTATVTLAKTGGISTAAAQTVVDGLAWRNSSDAPGTSARTITLTSLRDTGGTANGGVDTTVLSAAATVSLVAVNDAPTITAPGSISVAEDVPSALTGLSFGDVDAAGGSVTARFSVPTGMLGASSGGGVTASGSGTGLLTLVGSIADINSFIAAGNLGFLTAADATANVTLTVAIDDGGSTGADPGLSGTANSEAASTTVTLAVGAVNDAPVNTVPGAQTLNQDGQLVFSSGNGNAIRIDDIDAGSGTVRITLTATQGLLSLSGTTGLAFVVGSGTGDATMTLEGSQADINSALAGLIYTPTTGYSGAAQISLTTSDLGLAGSGGTLTDTDTIGLTVNPSNPVVTTLHSSSADGRHGIGSTITLTVTFDQAVVVDSSGGTPTLRLETGSTDRTATYLAGSGTPTLSFSYTVQEGDLSADLDATDTAALSLGGGTIRGLTGSNAVLTLPTVGGAASIGGQHAVVVDGVRPTASIVVADTALAVGDTSLVTITFSEAVSGLTGDDFTVANGALANITSNDGGVTWTATFTPTANVEDPSNLITLDNTGVADAAGNAGSGSTDSNNHAIDTRRPTVTLGSTSSALRAGQTAVINVTLSEAAADFSAADIAVTGGTLSGFSGSGTSYSATFTPDAGSTTAATLHVDSSRFTDAAGNANADGSDADNHLAIAVDTVVPAVTAGQQFSSAENRSAGALLGTVATDDVAGVDGFEITGGNTDGWFAIDAIGRITLTMTGAAALSPANDHETGPNDFTLAVRARDAAGNWSAPANVLLQVTDLNDNAPVAAADAAGTSEDTPVTVDVLANDSDADGDARSIRSASVPAAQGTVAIVGGRLVFTPAADFTGTATITYTATDGTHDSAPATLTVTVVPVDDTSVLVPDAQTIAEDGIATGNLLANDSDVDNTLQVASFRMAGDDTPYTAGQTATIPGVGTLVIGADGTATFTPAANWNGSAPAITYTTNTGGSSTLALQVTAVADAVQVSSPVVNEASPFAVFSVTGVAGEAVQLQLAGGSASAGGTDFGASGAANLEVSTDGGATWQAVDGPLTLPEGGTLLARTPVTDDGLRDNGETFSLTATPAGGVAASGTATIQDDGTGSVFGANGQADANARPSDDRPVGVSSPVVNEASPWAVFTVSGAAGQRLALALAGGSASAGGTDFGASGAANLEVSTDGGATWQAVDGPVTLPDGGSLLARTPVTDDGLRDNGETFSLTATPAGGTAAIGTATIQDDGSGSIFGANGQADANAQPSDDRPVGVSSPVVNEASPWAVFTVSGAAGQRLALALAGGSATLGDDVGTALEFFDGSTWQPVTGLVTMAGDTLLVRVAVSNDGRFEGAEQFMLRATPPGGTAATGTATLRDDGAGTVFDDAGQPSAAAGDDDRPRPVAEVPAAVVPVPAPAPVVVAPPVLPPAAPTWQAPVIDPGSPVSGGEVHTLTVGERTPDQFFGLNSAVRFPLPLGLFNASRPTEQLTLSAELADGRALPPWLSFNPSTRSFDGKAPAGLKGELVIKVSARDASGNQADVMFRLQIGETEDPGAANPAAPAAADPRQPARKTERPGRVSLQQQLKDLAPPRRTVADLPRAPAATKG